MKARTLLTIVMLTAAAASAEITNAVALEEDVRVEARLVNDAIASGGTIGVTITIENRTPAPIAVAERLCSAAYDAESSTIVVSIGSEIPDIASVGRLTIIQSGAKKTFSTGARLQLTDRGHGVFAANPRFVQIKVNVLRGWSTESVSDKQFDQWLDSNDTIFLNALPIYYVGHDPTQQSVSAEVK